MNAVRRLPCAALLLGCASSAHRPSAPPQETFANEAFVIADAKPVK